MEKNFFFKKKRHTAGILVRSVIAVFLPVAKEVAINAVAISASQLSLLTDGLISIEKRLDFFLSGLGITVVDRILPITCLLLNVKS